MADGKEKEKVPVTEVLEEDDEFEVSCVHLSLYSSTAAAQEEEEVGPRERRGVESLGSWARTCCFTQWVGQQCLHHLLLGNTLQKTLVQNIPGTAGVSSCFACGNRTHLHIRVSCTALRNVRRGTYHTISRTICIANVAAGHGKGKLLYMFCCVIDVGGGTYIHAYRYVARRLTCQQ